MLVNVGVRPLSVQVTVTFWVVMVLHDGALGNAVTEIVTGPAVAGQVNVGVSLSELRMAQTWVVPVTTTEPSPAAATEQLSWRLTGVVTSGETANPAAPE